jgi:hypothetical protein
VRVWTVVEERLASASPQGTLLGVALPDQDDQGKGSKLRRWGRPTAS